MSRLSQVLVVALVAVVGWVTLAGRPGRAEPEAPETQAGDARAAVDAAQPPQPPSIDRAAFEEQRRAARRDIEAKLQKRVTFTFKDEALRDVLAELGRAGGFTVWIDSRALADEGILEDEPITIEFDDLPIEQALNRILPRLDLTTLIDDEVLQVTTLIAAEEQLSTRVYNVARLLELKPLGHQPDEDGLDDVAFRQFGHATQGPTSAGGWILDVVQEFTSGPWEDIDGTGGTISLVKHLLIVRQTQDVQTEVERLLDVLELAADGKLERRSVDVRPASYPHAQDAQIHQALAGKTTLDLRDRPLNSAMEEVARRGGFPVLLDNKALQDEGISVDEPVTLHVTDVSWHSALRLLLGPLSLTFVVEDGVLKMTTEIAAEEKLVAVVYDITDLSEARLDGVPLIEAVQNCTSGPWEVVDGTGGTVDQPVAGILIVRQTQHVLGEVAALLNDLRQKARDRQAAVRPDPRKPLEPGQVVTHFYAVDPLLADAFAAAGEQAAPPDTTRPMRTSLERAILTFVAPDTWQDHRNGGDGAIEKVNELLVIRQTVRVHRELREFLERLERAAARTADAQHADLDGAGGRGSGRGGGFFGVPPAEDRTPKP